MNNKDIWQLLVRYAGSTFLCAAILLSCHSAPTMVAMMSPEQLRNVSLYHLCDAYNSTRSEKVKAELKRRNTIMSDKDWQDIENDRIRLGMREMVLVCSWGRPDSVNESVGSWGVHKQWVYRACDSCKAQYVYTENGKITSWSN